MYGEPVILGLIFLALGFSVGRAAWPTLALTWVGIGVVMPLTLSRINMQTRVTHEHLSVRWPWFHHTRIPLREIERAEPIRYDPLSQTGGWGVKHSRKLGRVLNVYGDRGVAIEAGEKRYLIGSQRPDELAEAVLVGAIASDDQRS
ncbi:MAG: hypothetical protein ACIARR_10855 [Phycisphaerales bacterium JB059]